MQIPTEITFNGIQHSDAVEAAVQRWVTRLEHVYDRITKCGITISQPHKRHRQGREFQVSLVLEVPRGEIVANHVNHEDIYVAIADAFRCARRQLHEHVDIQRGYVKVHVTDHPSLSLAKH